MGASEGWPRVAGSGLRVICFRRAGCAFEICDCDHARVTTLQVCHRHLIGSLRSMSYVLIFLQLVVALGIINVWLLRAAKATPYRGGNSKTMTEEFAAYGLPFWFMCVVGVLKLGLAAALVVAIWFQALARPAAIGMGLFMLGAFFMHLKVRDPMKKSLPAIAVLAMCAAIAVF